MGLYEGRNKMNCDNAEGTAWCVLAMGTGLAGLLRRGAVCSCPVLGSPQAGLSCAFCPLGGGTCWPSQTVRWAEATQGPVRNGDQTGHADPAPDLVCPRCIMVLPVCGCQDPHLQFTAYNDKCSGRPSMTKADGALASRWLPWCGADGTPACHSPPLQPVRQA